MRRDLRGSRVLLTGASSGIGRVLAGQLADAGAKLLLAARSVDKLDELANQLSSKSKRLSGRFGAVWALYCFPVSLWPWASSRW